MPPIPIYRGTMRGAGGGGVVVRAAQGLLAVALALVLSACGGPETEPTVVPTFPGPAQEGGASINGSGAEGVVPDDCGRILPAPDLEAVLGLPLGSVGLRTTIGVAEPSVGRTERVSCRYSRTSGPSRQLLDINVTAYRDAAAASAQWRINVDAESGDQEDVPLGSASAVLFEKGGRAVLMVAHSTSNITLVLPDQPLPGDRTSADLLVDLVLRVLPAVSVGTNAAPPPSTASATAPQAGAAR
jgi:hypothetical protein